MSAIWKNQSDGIGERVFVVCTIAHKWTGERFQFAEQIPEGESAEQHYNRIWSDSGFDHRLHRLETYNVFSG